MDLVFVLLPLSLALGAIGVIWFVWAVRSGQFDDLETPALRMLFDDQPHVDADTDTEPSGASRRRMRSR